MGVSVILLARDEADRIPACLESVQWADEIVVVVDAATKDDTAAICRAAGARVIEQPWQGFSKQWQTALDAATQEWVLMIAADERVNPALRDSIQAVVNQGTPYTVFEVQLYNLFWGRLLTCRYDYHLRLFRAGAGYICDKEVHEGWLPHDPQAPKSRLKGYLIHDSFRDFTHLMTKLGSYAELNAREITKHRRVTSIAPAIIHACGTFLKYHFVKGGFRDGVAGLVYNLAHAVYTFHKYAKAYELTTVARKREADKKTAGS